MRCMVKLEGPKSFNVGITVRSGAANIVYVCDVFMNDRRCSLSGWFALLTPRYCCFADFSSDSGNYRSGFCYVEFDAEPSIKYTIVPATFKKGQVRTPSSQPHAAWHIWLTQT